MNSDDLNLNYKVLPLQNMLSSHFHLLGPQQAWPFATLGGSRPDHPHQMGWPLLGRRAVLLFFWWNARCFWQASGDGSNMRWCSCITDHVTLCNLQFCCRLRESPRSETPPGRFRLRGHHFTSPTRKPRAASANYCWRWLRSCFTAGKHGASLYTASINLPLVAWDPAIADLCPIILPFNPDSMLPANTIQLQPDLSARSSLSHLSDGSISLAGEQLAAVGEISRMTNRKEVLTSAFHVDLRQEPESASWSLEPSNQM